MSNCPTHSIPASTPDPLSPACTPASLLGDPGRASEQVGAEGGLWMGLLSAACDSAPLLGHPGGSLPLLRVSVSCQAPPLPPRLVHIWEFWAESTPTGDP